MLGSGMRGKKVLRGIWDGVGGASCTFPHEADRPAPIGYKVQAATRTERPASARARTSAAEALFAASALQPNVVHEWCAFHPK